MYLTIHIVIVLMEQPYYSHLKAFKLAISDLQKILQGQANKRQRNHTTRLKTQRGRGKWREAIKGCLFSPLSSLPLFSRLFLSSLPCHGYSWPFLFFSNLDIVAAFTELKDLAIKVWPHFELPLTDKQYASRLLCRV